MDLDLIADALPRLLRGVPMTLVLVSASLVLGFALAVALALVRLSRHRIPAAFARAYIFTLRGTPLLIQIYFLYYGVGWWFAQDASLRQSWLWPVLREPLWYGILALTLNTAAYTAEILRGGIQSVPRGQIEAGRAVGMSSTLLFRRVVFPQALRQALPAYGNEVILMVKASALASTITIMEITGIARSINSARAAPFEIFALAGALYLVINITATRLIRLAERRLSRDRLPPH